MCEHCNKSHETFVEQYTSEEDDCCDFFPEDLELGSEELIFFCPEQPNFLVRETYVEDHLCAKHAQMEAEAIAETEAISASLGLRASSMVEIKEATETCEFIDFLNPKAPPCREPARYASIVTQEFLVCEEHLPAFVGDDKI